jgi:hypothetical protein
MARYIQASDEQIQIAKQIEESFGPLAVKAAAGASATLTATTKDLPEPTRITILLAGQIIVQSDVNPASAVAPVGAPVPVPIGPARLRIELVQRRRGAYLDVAVNLQAGDNALLIEWLEGYPPRATLGALRVNPVPGVQLVQTREFTPPHSEGMPLFIINARASLLSPREEVFDIWVDRKPVKCVKPFVIGSTVPVYHHERLSPGLHNVRVGLPRKQKIILDTDVVANGVDEVEVTIDPSVGGDSGIVVKRGGQTLLAGKTADLEAEAGTEGLFQLGESRDTIDGVDVPDGIDKDRVRAAKKFSEAMRNNYRKFLDERKRIREKKAKGEALTPDEQKIDQIDSYKKMQDWVEDLKRSEGYKIQEAGKTDAGGKSSATTPPPKTPWDKFQEDVTLKLHEPSHVEGSKKDAKDLRLDWDKLARFLELVRDPSTPAEPGDADVMKWGLNNIDKIKEYLKRRNDPDCGAEEEIGEYEKEIHLYEGVLQI